jgi:hypothetical protein
MEGFQPLGDQIPADMQIDVKGILLKVNFTDKPIILLIIFHCLIFMIAFLARSHKVWRVIVFGFCMCICLLTARIGKLVEPHWKELGFSANYFDETGVFLLFFVALPLVITCILLFSHLVGTIGGRIADRLVVRENPNVLPPKEEEIVNKDGKIKSE